MLSGDFDKLVAETRSTRRFRADIPVSADLLRELVKLARVTPSARNLQPLKYILVNSSDVCSQIFEYLGWAGALKNWKGPSEPERPAAYIVILGDHNIKDNFGCDHGIVAQTMMLGARSRGLGGCIIGSIDRERLRTLLKIDNHLEILLVLALGVPAEEIIIESLKDYGDINYWRDENDIHHVPKRSVEELIIGEFFK